MLAACAAAEAQTIKKNAIHHALISTFESTEPAFFMVMYDMLAAVSNQAHARDTLAASKTTRAYLVHSARH